VTARQAAPTQALDGLAGALSDLVCWMVFYFQRCEDDEVDLEVADELSRVIGDALRRLPMADRLRFLEHATSRAATSTVPDYHDFLVELAETLGLE